MQETVTWIDRHLAEHPFPQHSLALPERYRVATLQGMTPNTRAVVEEYLREFWAVAADGRAPLFLGRAGSGKSMAAAYLAMKLHQYAKLDVKWVSVPRWSVGLYDRIELQLQQYYKVPVLVMDDIHAITLQDRRPMMALNAVLSVRWDAQRPTIITGNLQLPKGGEWAGLVDIFGPAIARRMEESSTGFTVLSTHD